MAKDWPVVGSRRHGLPEGCSQKPSIERPSAARRPRKPPRPAEGEAYVAASDGRLGLHARRSQRASRVPSGGSVSSPRSAGRKLLLIGPQADQRLRFRRGLAAKRRSRGQRQSRQRRRCAAILFSCTIPYSTLGLPARQFGANAVAQHLHANTLALSLIVFGRRRRRRSCPVAKRRGGSMGAPCFLNGRGIQSGRCSTSPTAMGKGRSSSPRSPQAQNLPPKFLTVILSQMRRAGLVETMRGREGGYWLARPPAEISYGEIVRLTRGSLGPAALRQPARLRAVQELHQRGQMPAPPGDADGPRRDRAHPRRPQPRRQGRGRRDRAGVSARRGDRRRRVGHAAGAAPAARRARHGSP